MPATHDSRRFLNVSSSQGPFTLDGGTYGVAASATWGGGYVALQMLSPDGSTWINALPNMTANGYSSASLPPGQYQLAVSLATAVNVAVTRIVP